MKSLPLINEKNHLQLLRDETVFLSILENLNSGVALIDEHGRFISYNKKFLKLFGLSEDITINNVNDQNWAEWQVYNEDLNILHVNEHPVRKAAITGRSVSNQLVGVKLPGGSEIIWMLISAEPLSNDEGKIIKTICTYLDVTEHKLVDAELRRSEQRYRQLFDSMKEVVASRDKLFSVISHDLKSPFTSIIGFSELLVDKLAKGDINSAVDYARTILDSSWNTMELLTNLTDWSRMQTGQIRVNETELNYSSLINEVINLYKASAQHKSINLSVNTDESITIRADRLMIGSVLRNLVSNAIKFSNSDGVVTISAYSKNNILITEIIDQGAGMDEQLVNKLLGTGEYLSQPGTKNETGTGLGIIICKEFIARHDGQFYIESKPGQGTRFVFTLPFK